MHEVNQPTKLQVEAKTAALAYRGRFPFMVRMRTRAQSADWWPSESQAVSILRSRAWQASGSQTVSSRKGSSPK